MIDGIMRIERKGRLRSGNPSLQAPHHRAGQLQETRESGAGRQMQIKFGSGAKEERPSDAASNSSPTPLQRRPMSGLLGRTKDLRKIETRTALACEQSTRPDVLLGTRLHLVSGA